MQSNLHRELHNIQFARVLCVNTRKIFILYSASGETLGPAESLQGSVRDLRAVSYPD